MLPIPHKNKGVALITALLITAIIAVVAVAMASKQKLDIRRTGNIIDGDRAYVFALGVETWVRQVLYRDIKNSDTDSLLEDWALALPAIKVEGATVEGKLEDLQGKFNLNNLIVEDKPSELDLQRFRRLLTLVGAEPILAQAVLDWEDKNSDTIPDGAEDAEYMNSDYPRRAANKTLTSASELLLIKGFTSDIYKQLSPYITALPQHTSINVNTAPAQVLMMLGEGITEEDASALIAAREDESFKNVASFLQHKALAGRQVAKEGIDVKSNYFILEANTKFGRGQTRLYSLLWRKPTGVVDVIMRGQGIY